MSAPYSPALRAGCPPKTRARARGRDVTAGSQPFAPLVNVQAVAEYLDVDPGWVYAHSSLLGARRLGLGPKARLRFSLAEVDERLTACT